MGCSSSKDAVQTITVEDGVAKPTSGKARKIKVQGSGESNVNADDAVHVTSTKTTSAKSRDSGIEEMDGSDLPDGIITEESVPNLISEVKGDKRPETPNLSLIGRKFSANAASRERMKSQTILQELEAQGLISGTKVQKGGAAFEVGGDSPSVLEPLAPIRPPPRLERLKQDKPSLTKEDLEEKQLQAELRRQKSMHKPKKRSRLASQLSKDREMASNVNPSDAVNPEDGSSGDFDEEIANPFRSRREIPHD